MDIFSLLCSRTDTKEWANWIEKAGLAPLLSDPLGGPFTVFAPVSEALELVPGHENLLTSAVDDPSQLAPLVLYHIVIPTHTTSLTEDRGVLPGKLFTPSLANGTKEQRESLAGSRFLSGVEMQTMLLGHVENGEEGRTGFGGFSWMLGWRGMRNGGKGAGKPKVTKISTQIAAAAPSLETVTEASTDVYKRLGLVGQREGGNGIGQTDSFQVFLGPGSLMVGEGGRRLSLALGAFVAKVVVPDLNAVNGVVHGVSGVLTYPGYVRPDVDSGL
ncbi:unnamed protein product [Choristocarpus tenellus]